MNLTLLCFWIIPSLIIWLQGFSRQKTIENNSAWVFSDRLFYFGCCVFNPHCQVSINKSATWSIWLLPGYYPVTTILLSNSPKQAIFLHGADTLPWWITCPVLFKIVKGKSRELHLQCSVLYPNSFWFTLSWGCSPVLQGRTQSKAVGASTPNADLKGRRYL